MGWMMTGTHLGRVRVRVRVRVGVRVGVRVRVGIRVSVGVWGEGEGKLGWVTRGAHWVSIARDISRISPLYLPISPLYLPTSRARALGEHREGDTGEMQGRYRGDAGEMQGMQRGAHCVSIASERRHPHPQPEGARQKTEARRSSKLKQPPWGG